MGIRLRTLGGLALEAPGAGGARVLTQPKRLALLLYLTLAQPQRHHRRDVLLAMFWPELDRARATRSLRQALYFLRQSLPAGLIVNRGAEEIAVAAELVQSDVLEFERALSDGREADALALYAGDLLPGFHLADCPDFMRWLEHERERLRGGAARAARLLAERREEAGDVASATRLARAAVAYAPYDEVTLRDAAELLDRVGDRAGAAQLCDAFAARLNADIGVQPSPITRALTNVLRTTQPLTGAAAHSEPARADHPDARTAPARRSGAEPLLTDRISLEAYHAYQRALHHDGRRTPQSMQQALEEYERAVRYEPGFALAHSGIARALGVLTVYTPCRPTEMYARAQHHAAKAVALDPSLTDARVCLANVLVCSEWDWSAAEREVERAIAGDPRSAHAREQYALYVLTPTARFDEAVHQIELARELEPGSLSISTYTGAVNYFARRYERAIDELRMTLELSDSFALAWWFFAMSLEETKRLEDALEAAARASSLTAGSPLMRAQLARLHARAGNRQEAESILHEIEQEPATSFFAAGVHAALGQRDAALDALYRAYRDRSPHLVFAAVFPPLDVLRGERRFIELLLRMRLPRRAGPALRAI